VVGPLGKPLGKGAQVAVVAAKRLEDEQDARAAFSVQGGQLQVGQDALPGSYRLGIEVTTNTKVGEVKVLQDVDFAVTMPAKLSAKVTVGDQTFDLAYPATMGAEAVKVTGKTNMAVELGLQAQGVVPHQRMVIVRSTDQMRGKAANIEVPQGADRVTFDTAKIASLMGPVRGEHKLIVAVGDPQLEQSFFWEVGTLKITHKLLPNGKHPAQPRLPHVLSQGPLKEIEHVMRPAEKRPPVAISLLFAGLTASPLLFLAGGMKVLGANLGRFPSASVPALDAVLFHAGIAGVIGLYLIYWLQMTLLDMLPVLAGLLGFTAVFGYRALFHLANFGEKVKSE